MANKYAVLGLLTITVLIVSTLCLSISTVKAANQSQFDLEVERDPKTLEPKIMVLKDERKVAVKVRNNGPNSTTCQVGIKVWELKADGSKGSLKANCTSWGSGTERIPISGGEQKWVFIPVGSIDLNEPLKVEAYVANEIPVIEAGVVQLILGDDTNPTNNDAGKNFNIASKVSLDSVNTMKFVVQNPSEIEDTSILISTEALSPVPSGWTVSIDWLPSLGILVWGANSAKSLTLESGKDLHASFTVQTPATAVEGEFVNVKVTAINQASGETIFEDEFFMAYDTQPPEILSYTSSVDGQFINTELSTQDSSSIVELAEIYYSTDGGLTWASKQMSYSFDMECVSCKLTSKIGPFPYGTAVQYYCVVKDGVGNWVSGTIKTSTISAPVAEQPAIPMETTPVKLQDLNGNLISSGEAGRQVLLATDLSNIGTADQPLIYIIQVKDNSGSVAYLSFLQGTVPGGKTFTFGLAWTPETAGEYTVEAYAWKSWAEPTPLSKPSSETITVT